MASLITIVDKQAASRIADTNTVSQTGGCMDYIGNGHFIASDTRAIQLYDLQGTALNSLGSPYTTSFANLWGVTLNRTQFLEGDSEPLFDGNQIWVTEDQTRDPAYISCLERTSSTVYNRVWSQTGPSLYKNNGVCVDGNNLVLLNFVGGRTSVQIWDVSGPGATLMQSNKIVNSEYIDICYDGMFFYICDAAGVIYQYIIKNPTAGPELVRQWTITAPGSLTSPVSAGITTDGNNLYLNWSE